jgi:hypothetical protein
VHDKRAQIDAYLSSIYENNDEKYLKEKISRERKADIISPNETLLDKNGDKLLNCKG